MKKFVLLAVIAVMFSACSTCYECSSDVVLTNGSGDSLGTSANVEEFCTADGQEVEDKENDGATCKVQ